MLASLWRERWHGGTPWRRERTLKQYCKFYNIYYNYPSVKTSFWQLPWQGEPCLKFLFIKVGRRLGRCFCCAKVSPGHPHPLTMWALHNNIINKRIVLILSVLFNPPVTISSWQPPLSKRGLSQTFLSYKKACRLGRCFCYAKVSTGHPLHFFKHRLFQKSPPKRPPLAI